MCGDARTLVPQNRRGQPRDHRVQAAEAGPGGATAAPQQAAGPGHCGGGQPRDQHHALPLHQVKLRKSFNILSASFNLNPNQCEMKLPLILVIFELLINI